MAEKPDSQDICFVPNGSYASVIEKLRPGAVEPGEIVDLDGNVLGEHAGVIGFTVGQRRGLGLGGGDPMFVVRLDAEPRQVIVGPRDALASRSLTLGEVNWLGESSSIPTLDGWDVAVRVRSTRPPKAARLVPHGVDGARWNC